MTDVVPAFEPESPLYNTEYVASVEKVIPDQVGNDNSLVEEPVGASADLIDETPAEEPQPSDGSNNEPNMTDEEFEAFMKKAQAFYDSQASENSDNSDDSDDDDFSSIEVHSGD